jgi:hypothetical protein
MIQYKLQSLPLETDNAARKYNEDGGIWFTSPRVQRARTGTSAQITPENLGPTYVPRDTISRQEPTTILIKDDDS